MTIWVDAHLSPAIATWITSRFGVEAVALRIIWLTCGNTSNGRLREILGETLPRANKLLAAGETLVEISGG